MVTSCPFFASSLAAVKPAGPEPITATFFPVGCGLSGIKNPFFRSQSATNLSNAPIATGSPILFNVQAPSHWFS